MYITLLVISLISLVVIRFYFEIRSSRRRAEKESEQMRTVLIEYMEWLETTLLALDIACLDPVKCSGCSGIAEAIRMHLADASYLLAQGHVPRASDVEKDIRLLRERIERMLSRPNEFVPTAELRLRKHITDQR